MVTAMLLSWGVAGIYAAPLNPQKSMQQIDSPAGKMESIGSRGAAWCLLPGNIVLYAQDIKGYWSVARHNVPSIFDIEKLTQEQKFKLMLFVLTQMESLGFEQRDNNYNYNYQTALRIINKKERYFSELIKSTQLSNARSEQLKSTLLQKQFHYTIKKIVVAHADIAQAIVTKVNSANINHRLSVLKNLAQRCSIAQTITVPEISLTAMPLYYRKHVQGLELQKAHICEDKERHHYHILLLIAKEEIPFIYDEVEFFEYTIPLAVYPKEHIAALRQPQTQVENQAVNNQILENMLTLILKPNFDPLQDQSRIWIKRTMNILYCEDISLPISNGASLWTELNPQSIDGLDRQIIGDPSTLNSRKPYFFRFFKNYENFLKKNKTFCPTVRRVEKNGKKYYSIIFINKVTKVNDKPHVVIDFILKTLLVEDAHVIAQILDSIKTNAKIFFYLPQQQMLQEFTEALD